MKIFDTLIVLIRLMHKCQKAPFLRAFWHLYGIVWSDNLDIETETIYEDGETVRHEKPIVHQESAHAVAAARAIAGISQKQLAELSGIDQSDISKIERGIANPSVATLDRIAKALGGQLAISIEIPTTA